MFTGAISSLAEETVSDRPRRERAGEAAELERQRRFEQGLCRDCDRKRPATGKLCKWCRRRIERNTVRDAEKQARRGRLSIRDCDQADAKLAMRAFAAGFSGLDAIAGRDDLNRNERKRFELEPLSQLLLGVKSAFEIAKRRGEVDEWLEAIKASLSRD